MRSVETRLCHLDPENPDRAILVEAAEILRSGGLVAFPTETVYGLGANALDANAVARIFEAKGRPSQNPLIVHVPDVESAKRVVSEWSETAERLARHFWAGSLTLVLPKSPAIPSLVTAGGESVAVRVPAHPIAQELLRVCGFPLAAPSANPSNWLSPTRAEHVWQGLVGRVEMILDGGATTGGVESTVLSLIHTPPRLLRPGLVLPSQIREVIGEIEVDAKVEQEETLLSPGQLLKHYSPHTPLHLVGEEVEKEIHLLLEEGKRVGWLTHTSTLAPHTNLITVSMPTFATEYAARLFDVLHRLDALGLDAIFVSLPPTDEAWYAVQDRLKRACVTH